METEDLLAVLEDYDESIKSKRLYRLLNLSPGEQLNCDAVMKEVKRDPCSVGSQYDFLTGDFCYPLHQAVRLGANLRFVSVLYSSYPPAVEASVDGSTLLHLSIEHMASPEVISFLYQKWPAAAKEKDSQGRTPLHLATNAPDEVVSLLLDSFPKAVLEQDDNGHKPIICARLSRKHTNLVRFLRSKPDFNEMDDGSLLEIMRLFMSSNWLDGAALVLDTNPSLYRFLDIDLRVFPHFLSTVGCRCTVETMWHIISNKQDLL